AVVKDSSDNGKYGVMRKGATHSYGIRGQAANLDGNTGYIAITPIGELKSATVAAWINLHTVRTEPSSLLCSDGTAPGALKLVINGSGNVQWGVEGQPVQTSDYRFTTEHAGEWHHAAVTYDPRAKAVSFYIDGKLDVTRALADAPPLNLSTQVRLGGANGGARCLDGELDEFRVFERALSAGEIAALAAKPSFTSIADVKKLQDGTAVVLMSKPVTLAQLSRGGEGYCWRWQVVYVRRRRRGRLRGKSEQRASCIDQETCHGQYGGGVWGGQCRR
ncbi:MAG: LamG domain-containing protein, partial [Verrucomicrobia bacterium]|nr:LamG domain-containing protein [Verrucomicrobiota bacterium]